MVFNRIKRTRLILQTFFNLLKKEGLFEEYFNELENGILFRYAKGIPYSSNLFLLLFEDFWKYAAKDILPKIYIYHTSLRNEEGHTLVS